MQEENQSAHAGGVAACSSVCAEVEQHAPGLPVAMLPIQKCFVLVAMETAKR